MKHKAKKARLVSLKLSLNKQPLNLFKHDENVFWIYMCILKF